MGRREQRERERKRSASSYQRLDGFLPQKKEANFSKSRMPVLSPPLLSAAVESSSVSEDSSSAVN